MTYSIAIARHRFSMWAACRAAQAGSAKAKRAELIAALRSCGVVEFLSDEKNHSISSAQYDERFDSWVVRTQKHLEQVAKTPVMFGIAAKLISTYLKSVFLLGGFHDTALSHHLIPPIDSILLGEIDKVYGTELAATHKWQKLTQQDYKTVVTALRSIGAGNPVWHLEKHWEP